MIKDTKASDREIASQLERIEKIKDDPEKDDHDVKKQQEVLDEYKDGKKDEYSRLYGFYGKLLEKVQLEADEPEPTAIRGTDEFQSAVDALKQTYPILLASEHIDQQDVNELLTLISGLNLQEG